MTLDSLARGEGRTITTIIKKKKHPTTNGGMQNRSSVGIHTQCVHVFARLALICMLSRCLVTKFLRRSSVRTYQKCAVGWAWPFSPPKTFLLVLLLLLMSQQSNPFHIIIGAWFSTHAGGGSVISTLGQGCHGHFLTADGHFSLVS